MAARTSLDDAERVLRTSRVIAVLGAHKDPVRPAHYVPAYLRDQGYDVRPVNPRFVGQPLFGACVTARLDEIRTPVDVVDVFRPSSALAAHLDEILAMNPLPRVVWLQLGIFDEDVVDRLRAAGLEVVVDRCTLADHRALGLPARST